METVEYHDHEFDSNQWPFQDPINSATISTKQVFEFGYPILRVCHDGDGDWQILCGTTNDPVDGIVVCLGCAYEKDNSIGELSDLPLGWNAWRKDISSKWVREESLNDEEDD